MIVGEDAQPCDFAREPLQGADPDLLYLHKVEPFPEPDYDSRHRQLVVDHTVDQDNGEYIRTYTTQVRPNDERTQAAEDEESFQFQRHFPVERVALHTAIMVGLIYEFTVNQQSIPAKFQPFATAYRNRVKDKVLPNFDRLNAIIADIEAGNEPDMDSGWSDPNA